MIDDLDDVDREALERALKLAEADGRAEQLASMLQDRPWFEVASFAAYSCQNKKLNLKPWQSPPCSLSATQPEPEAEQMARRLLAAGLSQYEPDPITALAMRSR